MYFCADIIGKKMMIIRTGNIIYIYIGVNTV